MVTVLEVDAARKRVALSLKDGDTKQDNTQRKQNAGPSPIKKDNIIKKPANAFQAKLQELKKNFKD